MATYYWVGGNGTWDATTTTSWASSSGGAGGAGVPTAADNVIFDSSSNVGDYSVTIGLSATPATCADLSISFPLVGVVTIISAATSVINVYGSLLVQSSTVFTSASGSLLNFLATSTGKTISTNSVAMGALGIVFNSAAGGWTLSTGLTCGAVTVTSTASAGFNTNGQTCSWGSLLSTGSVARTISLGASAITLTGTATVVNFLAATNLTFNAGTSTITCSAVSPSLRGSGQTFYNVVFTSASSGTSTIQGSNTFNNLTQTSRSAGGQRIVSVDGDNTITGTLTLQTLGTPNATQRTVVWSSDIGTRRTITAAALSGMTDVDFRDIAGAGAASWTGTRIGNLLNNTGITFTTGANKYWVLAAGGLWSSGAWSLTPGGAPATANFPLAQDTVYIDLTTITSGSTINISIAWQIPTVICTRASGSNTLIMTSSTISPQLYGSWTSCAGMSFTAPSNAWEFVGQGLTQTVTSAGIPFTQGFNVSSVTGTVLLADAFTTSAVVFTLINGTLALNGYTLTTGIFSSSNSNTRVLAFGTGKIVITGNSTTVCTTITATNLTITGSKRIELSYSGSTGTRIISGVTTAVEGANLLDYYITAGSDIVTFSSLRSYGTIDFYDAGTSTFTGTWQNGTNTVSLYGDLAVKSGMTVGSGSNAINMLATSGTKTITSAGQTMDFPITFNGVGGTWQLQDALTIGATRTVTLTNGTLDLNGYTLSTGVFSSSNSNTRTLTLSNGTFFITGSSWNTGTLTNLTTDASGTISMSSASAKTFNGGGGTWSKLLNSGAGALTITGTNTFMELGNSVSPTSFVFPATLTTSAYAYSINGTASNLVSLRSSNPGTKYTLAKL